MAFVSPTVLPRLSFHPSHSTPSHLCRLTATARNPSQDTSLDAFYIRRCVDLARQAEGQTRPNPPVGCVITTQAGIILGEGYHHRAGEPHAEANAIADARSRNHSLVNATAYVSLEPCNHFGRTPPCSQALVSAGVSRVVIGILDPDPRTAGAGAATLRAAGIHVVEGVEYHVCQELTAGFIRRVKRNRPLGILKYAMTLDGRIAASDGSSRWVTGEQARARVHEMRRAADAIVVGGGTLRMDDPRLTIRDGRETGKVSPLRVVMTRGLDLPVSARAWEGKGAVVLANASHGRPAVAAELRARGVVVEEVAGLTPDDAMKYLAERECLQVMWECGGGLAAEAIRCGAVQRVHAFVAPKIIGGKPGATPVGEGAVNGGMTEALVLKRRTVERFDNGDVLISGHLQEDAE